MEAKRIAIVNMKGGVAKTTTAVHLAVGLALQLFMENPERPGRVLFLTLDPQADGVAIVSNTMRKDGSSSTSPETIKGRSMADLLLDDDAPPANSLIHKAKIPTFMEAPNLDYIPANPTTMSRALEEIGGLAAREFRLKEAIEPLLPLYRYVVIDTPTTSKVMIYNALVAATHFIVPLQFTGASFRYLDDVLASVKTVQTRLKNTELQMLGILPSKASTSRSEYKLVETEMKQSQFVKYLFSPIRELADVSMAFSLGMDIFSYRPPRNFQNGYVSENDAAKDFYTFICEAHRRLVKGV